MGFLITAATTALGDIAETLGAKNVFSKPATHAGPGFGATAPATKGVLPFQNPFPTVSAATIASGRAAAPGQALEAATSAADRPRQSIATGGTATAAAGVVPPAPRPTPAIGRLKLPPAVFETGGRSDAPAQPGLEPARAAAAGLTPTPSIATGGTGAAAATTTKTATTAPALPALPVLRPTTTALRSRRRGQDSRARTILTSGTGLLDRPSDEARRARNILVGV